jgi:hypothetical protein
MNCSSEPARYNRTPGLGASRLHFSSTKLHSQPEQPAFTLRAWSVHVAIPEWQRRKRHSKKSERCFLTWSNTWRPKRALPSCDERWQQRKQLAGLHTQVNSIDERQNQTKTEARLWGQDRTETRDAEPGLLPEQRSVTLVIDTNSIVKKLEQRGFSRMQAEGLHVAFHHALRLAASAHLYKECRQQSHSRPDW